MKKRLLASVLLIVAASGAALYARSSGSWWAYCDNTNPYITKDNPGAHGRVWESHGHSSYESAQRALDQHNRTAHKGATHGAVSPE